MREKLISLFCLFVCLLVVVVFLLFLLLLFFWLGCCRLSSACKILMELYYVGFLQNILTLLYSVSSYVHYSPQTNEQTRKQEEKRTD